MHSHATCRGHCLLLFQSGTRRRRQKSKVPRAQLLAFEPEDIVLESGLGSMGYRVVSAPRSAETRPRLAEGRLMSWGDAGTVEGTVEVRLYTGRVCRGALSGTRVFMKAYPRPGFGDSDALAANEVAAHAALQQPLGGAEGGFGEPPNLYHLLGGFTAREGAAAGEQWLVFQRAGISTAAEYAALAAQATQGAVAVGEPNFYDSLNPKRPLRRRCDFIVRLLRGALEGLAHMHARDWLHQSLGPSSVVLSTVQEGEVQRLNARLRDLAFALDVSDQTLVGGATLGEIWDRGTVDAEASPQGRLGRAARESLFERAREGGAVTRQQHRSYGIADDIYAAGLLLAFMAFLPFCAPGSCSEEGLRRLLEVTFRDDLPGFRAYCGEDEAWARGVGFLDGDGGAGWALLGAMLHPEWRLRPTATSCLAHPFLAGRDWSGEP